MSDAPSARTRPHYLIPGDNDEAPGLPVVQGPDYTGEVRVGYRDDRGVEVWSLIMDLDHARGAWHYMGADIHRDRNRAKFGLAPIPPSGTEDEGLRGVSLDRDHVHLFTHMPDAERDDLFGKLGDALERIDVNIKAEAE